MSESYQRTANSGEPNQPIQAPAKHAEEGVSEKANERPDVAGDEKAADQAPEPDQDYPEQKHAGAVGYGPNYLEAQGHVTMGERMDGLKEELEGHITRNQDAMKEGHDKRTGDAKRRKIEEDRNPQNAQSAFENPEKKQEQEQSGEKQEGGGQQGGERPATSTMQAEEKSADQRAQDEHPSAEGRS